MGETLARRAFLRGSGLVAAGALAGAARRRRGLPMGPSSMWSSSARGSQG